MLFTELPLAGAFQIDLEPLGDDRGFLARTFCRREFQERGLNPAVDQASLSFSHKRGTLRGLHYQASPHGEDKLVRCVAGAIYDVAVDLRPKSPTYLTWCSMELSAENRRAFYIPSGMAHGFLTLTDDVQVFYLMSHPFVPESVRGVRWDDPLIGIDWPNAPAILAARDAAYPDLAPLESRAKVRADVSLAT